MLPQQQPAVNCPARSQRGERRKEENKMHQNIENYADMTNSKIKDLACTSRDSHVRNARIVERESSQVIVDLYTDVNILRATVDCSKQEIIDVVINK